jgi:hypothetical protein
MKSFYKECEVDVTAVYVSPAKRMLTPRVEINYENMPKPQWLTTKEHFQVCERSRAIRRDDGTGMD